MSYLVASGHVESLHNGRMVGPGELARGVNPRHPHDKRLIDRGALVKRVTKTPAAAPSEPKETGGTNQPAAEPQNSKETNK